MRSSTIKIILFCVLLTPNLAAQDKTGADSIQFDTDLVSIPVVVKDRDGKHVAGLTSKDFSLFEDGKPRLIDFFANGDEPLNIALLLDTSPGTESIYPQIKRAASEFIRLLSRDDKALIVTFDTRIRPISSLTGNRIELEQAIRSSDAGLETGAVMRDAVASILKGELGKTKGRRAIIVLSNGLDSGSRTDKDLLLTQLEQSDTLIYTVFYKSGLSSFASRPGGMSSINGATPIGSGPFQKQDGAKYMKKMSEITGASFYDDEIENLGGVLAGILEDLRQQYRIGFYLPEASKQTELHSLEVKVDRKDVEIRFRGAYRTN